MDYRKVINYLRNRHSLVSSYLISLTKQDMTVEYFKVQEELSILEELISSLTNEEVSIKYAVHEGQMTIDEIQ